MELFTRDALQRLAVKQTPPCISLFMPTHRAGPEIRQDPTRLKNLLAEVLLRDEKAPLVPVGVDELHPIFRAANTYKHLFEEGITMNVGALNEQELHARAWSIVAPFFAKQQRDRLDFRQDP